MRAVKIFAILVLIGLIGFVLAEALGPGSQVTDFSLKDYTGKEHKLSAYKDKAGIVIIFVATRCPVSNAYNERMEALYKEYSAKNIAFLGINPNKEETAEEVQQHAKEHGLTFTILKDAGNVVADQFGATVTPEVFLLNKDMKVVYHGRIDDSQREAQVKKRDLKKALDDYLANKQIVDADTKAFGCSIKRVR